MVYVNPLFTFLLFYLFTFLSLRVDLPYSCSIKNKYLVFSHRPQVFFRVLSAIRVRHTPATVYPCFSPSDIPVVPTTVAAV